jgi:cell division protein FtsL
MGFMVHDFQKNKKGVKSQMMIWGGAVVLLTVGILLVIADVKMYHKRQELNVQVKMLQNKITETQKSNNQLQQGISVSNIDQYIEKVAREQLDLQKPGEKVISFVQSSDQQLVAPMVAPSFLQSWLGWIGGWFKK